MRKYIENVSQIKVMQEMKKFYFKSDFEKLLQNLGLSFLLCVVWECFKEISKDSYKI